MPELEHSSSNVGPPQQLLREPALTQSTPHTLRPTVCAEQFNRQLSSSCLLSQPAARGWTQQASCTSLTYASHEVAGIVRPPVTEDQPFPTNQQKPTVVHSKVSAIMHMTTEAVYSEAPARIPLPPTMSAPVCDLTPLVTDLPMHSKRPKTVDTEEATFASVLTSVPLHLPPDVMQAADRAGFPGDVSSAGSHSQACELRSCALGANNTRLGYQSAKKEKADTVQLPATTTVTGEAHNGVVDNYSFNSSFALARTNSETCGSLLDTSHRGEKLNSYMSAEVSRSLTDNEDCSKFPLSSQVSATELREHEMDVDSAAIKLASNERMQGTHQTSMDLSGTDGDCMSHTSTVVRSSRADASLPPYQKSTGQTGLADPSLLQADQIAPCFINDRSDGAVSRSVASEKAPSTISFSTDGYSIGCEDASCNRHCGSCRLPSVSGNGVLCEAPEEPAVDQGRINVEPPTLCRQTAVTCVQKVDVAKLEKGHDLEPQGRIYWGKKRGPYDRPVRVLLNGDPQTYSHSGKEQAAVKCRIPERHAGDEKLYAATAETMQMGGEPESSSSMASTRATTPVTRTSNGSSSSTSSVTQNPSGVEVVPSLAAAPLTTGGLSDPPSSAGKRQPHTAIPESQVAPQVPRRRLVRLCDNDEEIWNEWEGQSMLGEGVYGRVYLVRSRKTGEERAFKRMYLQMSRFTSNRSNESAGCDQAEGDSNAGMTVANGGLPAVVQREIASLKALQGVRNVIRLEEVFIGSRRVYLSFPVVRGGSLTELLRRYAVWQEHLLTLHQTASSACTAPSPAEDPLPMSSTEGSCEFSTGAHGDLRQVSSSQRCHNNRSDCRDSRGVGCPAPSKRDCCHTSRWDCRSSSSGRCDCTSSTNTNDATCYLDPHASTTGGCRCCTEVAGNSTQKGAPSTVEVPRHKPCPTCLKDEEGSCTHSADLGIEGVLAVDAAALATATRTGCHCSALGTSTSIQFVEKVRRSSTRSSKKEDEYPSCGSHACVEASSSLLRTTGISASVDSALTRCLSTAAAVCCCCCSTLHHEKEDEYDNGAMDSSLSASRSTCAASSSSRSSCLSTVSLRNRTSSLVSSRSFFSPPFSYPQMPPCGLPLPLAKSIVQAILRGITACHERRIAHRDMKPDNILLDWIPQAPPSPPPPPPSPASSRSTFSSYFKQTGSHIEQTQCCTTVGSCCVQPIRCFDKQAYCTQLNFLAGEVRHYSGKRVCCCSKQSCLCNKQVGCCPEASQSHCSCVSHTSASEGHERAQSSGPAPAGGHMTTCTLDVGTATTLLLLRNAQTEGDEVSRLKRERLIGPRATQAISENDTKPTGKAAEEEASRRVEACRDVNTTTEPLPTMKQQQDNAESGLRKKDESVVCSRKREPTFCTASSEEGENACPRRRKCMEATEEIRESKVDATGKRRPDHGSVAGAPVASAGVAAVFRITAGVEVDAGERGADPAALVATQAAGGTVRDEISSGLFGSSSASVEGNGHSCAAAARTTDSTYDFTLRTDVDAREGAAVTRNHSGTVAVKMEAVGGTDGGRRSQEKEERHSEATDAEVGSSAVVTVGGTTEEEDGDALSGSTSSKTAVEEEEEEASSDTQQSEESSGSPEYPPLPTRLVIADFGLARTLPFHIPLSTSVPLTPPSLRTNQQQSLHKCQRTQFVLPATAAVPSTRCTSSSGSACWVGYNSGCSGPCYDAKDGKGGGSVALHSHAASVSSAKSATDQQTAPREAHSEEVPQVPVEKCQCRCKRWRSEMPGETNWQKTAHTTLKLPCDGSRCSSKNAENACCTWWVHCTSASTTQHCAEGRCHFCGQGASRKSGKSTERMESLPPRAALLPIEGAEVHEVEGTPEEQREEEENEKERTTSQLFPSPQSTPLYSSATFCLSPEIITLNYRPLDVLLGSSSYSLGVDIWSVGCIFMELLTGCELIDGCTEFQCIVAIMRLFGNPWKKTENSDAKRRDCCLRTQPRRGGEFTYDSQYSGCNMSSSCCCGYVGGPSQLYDVCESCEGISEAGKTGAPSEAASAATTCCCALPAKTAQTAGRLQSACSAGRKRALRGRKKPSTKPQMDKSGEWRFWSEALPAFRGEDRPLERILRESGRLDAVADPHLLDFASRLLTVLPDMRITASDALLHPFFDDVRIEDEL